MPMLVSVVIPCYNCGKYIQQAIDSVKSQTYKGVEIIIVDDGSTDNSKDVILRNGNAVTYIFQENKGVSAARNAGIKAARGEYIAFLDADDYWAPEKLEKQLALFEKHREIASVNCGLYVVNERGEIFRTVPLDEMKTKEMLLKELLVNNPIHGGGSGVIAKKDCIIAAGMFDETVSGSEDRDLWYRLIKAYNMRFIREPYVYYRIHAGNAHGKIEMMMRDQMKFVRKHQGDYTIPKRLKAVSYSYYDAAMEYDEAGKHFKAFTCTLLSILAFPWQNASLHKVRLLAAVLLKGVRIKQGRRPE